MNNGNNNKSNIKIYLLYQWELYTVQIPENSNKITSCQVVRQGAERMRVVFLVEINNTSFGLLRRNYWRLKLSNKK